MKKRAISVLSMLFVCATIVWGQVQFNFSPDKYGTTISDVQYGIFFEEINHAADGGLWSEMIRNRSFEDSAYEPEYWVGWGNTQLSLGSDHLMNEAQQYYLHVTPSGQGANFVHEGYWGMRLDGQSSYTFSFFVRADEAFTSSFGVRLLDYDSYDPLFEASQKVNITNTWQKVTMTISDPNKTVGKARLQIMCPATLAFDMDVISLMPAETYKGHGCRKDLAQMLEDLKPRFMRFPGGCYVEGEYRNDETNRFEWKKTIGSIENRPGHWNINWNYRSSDAFGFHEMLQLSEDLGAIPLFVVNVGLGHGWYEDMNNLHVFIQEAIDAIQYANGDVTTTWGAKRAANGHPEPFGLKYIEIGNENYNYRSYNNSDQSYQYAERYNMFYQAIKAAYPDIVCIGNVEAWSTDNPSWRNDYPVDVLDEHYYRSPSWFAGNYEKYDTYDRSGAKIYVGEYAVTQSFGTTGNLAAALGEAIYMQGIERNSDMVTMASYAPIFVNEHDQKWMPDMIRFDATQSYGTPSYYVQKLMSEKLGKKNITWTEQNNNTHEAVLRAGLSTWSTSATFTNYKIYKDGVLVYTAPFDGTNSWTDLAGTFQEESGVLYQNSTSMQGQLYLNEDIELGDNYTIEVTATKTGGKEGFLIAFGYEDANNYCWWNLGGWSNSKHCLEVCANGTKSQYSTISGYLENDRPYNLRIEVASNHVKCYIDDELYHDVILPLQRRIYTSANRDGNKLFVKLTNPNGEDYQAKLVFDGYTANNLVLTQMAASSDQAENDHEHPYVVTPNTRSLVAYGTEIFVTIPAYSFNILEMELTEGESGSMGVMPEEGFYYLKKAYDNAYLSRGATWGTRATLTEFGIPLDVRHVSEDLYSIRYCDYSGKYFSLIDELPYTDGALDKEWKWRFLDAAEGRVILQNSANGKYFACTSSEEGGYFTDVPSEAVQFVFVSPTQYEKTMASYNPLGDETRYCIGKDVSHLVTNASMEQGVDGWTSTFHLYYKNGNPSYTQPANRANVNEAFERVGSLTQTVSGLTPNGIYRFSLPAFFRPALRPECLAADAYGLVLGNAYLICGDQTVRLKTWAEDRTSDETPNTMEEAAACFNQGLYQNQITGRADEEGKLTIGLAIDHRISGQWLIWGGAKLEELSNPVDYTSYIINPSFESDISSGWTNNGMQRQSNNEGKARKTGSYYCEKWVDKGTMLPDASVKQTVVGLESGDYLVTATCHAERQGSNIDITGVYLMAGDQKTLVSTTDTYQVVATAVGGELTIGFGCENTNANWITVDNFTLTWIGSSAENNKAALQVLIEKLQQLVSTKKILSQQQRDDAANAIAAAQQAQSDEEVTQSLTALTAKYEELDAYRLPIERHDNCNAYLFAYFPNNENEHLYYALSTDGFNFTPLNNGNRILNSWDFTKSGGIRDPHILRGEDGVFRMVNTDMRCALGWNSNRGIVMSKSTDLINWTHTTIHFPTRFPNGWSSVTRVWAPETVYDREAGKYMVYFSLLTSDDGTCNYDKVFYCYANDDFTDLVDYPIHMFDRGSATIDADIIYDETDQLYHMIYKNEGINSISHVTAERLTAKSGEPTGSQWGELGGAIQQTSVAVEGGGLFRLIDTNIYVLMYDCYGSGYYQFCTTTDWKKYDLAFQTERYSSFTPRHGSVTPLHPQETRALLDAFPTDGFDIDCTTGVSSVDVVPSSPAAIYDLQGRKLSGTPAKGIYIQNNRKFVAQ